MNREGKKDGTEGESHYSVVLRKSQPGRDPGKRLPIRRAHTGKEQSGSGALSCLISAESRVGKPQPQHEPKSTAVGDRLSATHPQKVLLQGRETSMAIVVPL